MGVDVNISGTFNTVTAAARRMLAAGGGSIIITASGNSTLASLIQNLSGGTLRARLWRSVTERGAIEMTKRRHWDIYEALREHDADRASAADLIHLSEGEQWLRHMLEADEAGAP